MNEKRWVVLLLLVFLLLSTTYSIVTPIFEASDELWHYPVIQYMASGHGLPVQTPTDHPGLWKQQASQPPLYYALAALFTAWIDTSDLTATLHPNPHGAVGVVTPDGNINLVAHDPAREAWPWRGTVLAVHVARFLSVILSAVTVYLTYRLGRKAFPGRAEVSLGAAALTAFIPMFVFISGSVNNDNLTTPLCALAMLIIIRQNEIALGDERRLMWGWVVLGVVIGLATLSKVSGAGLLSLAALAGAWVAWQRGSTVRDGPTLGRRSVGAIQLKLALDWRHLFAAGCAIGFSVLFVTGWWFWRNVQLYGDLLGFKLFLPYFTRDIPADLPQIWSERNSFLYGFWGNFGGLNLPIPSWAFIFLNTLLLLAVIGLVIAMVRWFLSLSRNLLRPSATGHRLSAIPAPVHGAGAGVSHRQFAQWLVILWAIIVFVGWLSWTRTTWSSQGRLVFYALPAYSILILAGLAAWLPRRVAPFVISVLTIGLAVFAAAMPFTVIAPAYAHPAQLTQAQITSIPQRADVRFGDALVLLGYDVPSAFIRPGDSLRLTLYWQAIRPTSRPYSVFLHLLDENEVEVQDKGPAYPGRGNLPSTTLVPGQTWAETWDVPVRGTAYAPARLIWELGLFDAVSGARLAVADKYGRASGDNFRFGQINLQRPANSPFNLTSANYGDEIELIGFDLDRRAVKPGETVNLTLFWRALKTPSRDYTIFAHVLQPPQTKWAGYDKQPVLPTSQWKQRQVISETYPLELDPATPSGVYEIEVGVYYLSGPSSFERLKILTRDGRQQQDFALLSKVRVTR